MTAPSFLPRPLSSDPSLAQTLILGDPRGILIQHTRKIWEWCDMDEVRRHEVPRALVRLEPKGHTSLCGFLFNEFLQP